MRSDSIELFSDYFAQATNALTHVDARVKLVFMLAVLSVVLIGNSIGISLLVAVMCISVLLLIKIPFKMVLVRLVGPLIMAGVILLLQGFLSGDTPLHTLSYAGLTVSIYKEGISKGTVIAGRVIAGTSLVLLLSMTTPVNKLLGALKYFKVPSGWLEVTIFAYRYIFVFIEEAQGIMDAQRLRLGYRGIGIGLRSWGILAGSLFTRVYDQANATHTAMTLRGYNGMLYIKDPDRLTPRDVGAGLLMALIFSLLLLATIFWG
ncbi:MAG TPA: cobalt ECF transporter T component CbiQ [Anaerolineae bacterium]|jgi:cobalt/nickel transport system permease protein|nr:cobalt ECF transporter T component CbiQ [Anaerolineae bacterium]